MKSCSLCTGTCWNSKESMVGMFSSRRSLKSVIAEHQPGQTQFLDFKAHMYIIQFDQKWAERNLSRVCINKITNEIRKARRKLLWWDHEGRQALWQAERLLRSHDILRSLTTLKKLYHRDRIVNSTLRRQGSGYTCEGLNRLRLPVTMSAKDFLITLTDVERHILIISRAIPWVRILNGIKTRKLQKSQHPGPHPILTGPLLQLLYGYLPGVPVSGASQAIMGSNLEPWAETSFSCLFAFLWNTLSE